MAVAVGSGVAAAVAVGALVGSAVAVGTTVGASVGAGLLVSAGRAVAVGGARVSVGRGGGSTWAWLGLGGCTSAHSSAAPQTIINNAIKRGMGCLSLQDKGLRLRAGAEAAWRNGCPPGSSAPQI
ncbi:MAG: hypothetical protein OHK0022_21720 [Roseiflexaceae bacterium]